MMFIFCKKKISILAGRLDHLENNDYMNTIEMNSVDYAIPENYDTVLNTDNGSVPNVYINSDTGGNTYDTID